MTYRHEAPFFRFREFEIEGADKPSVDIRFVERKEIHNEKFRIVWMDLNKLKYSHDELWKKMIEKTNVVFVNEPFECLLCSELLEVRRKANEESFDSQI